MIKNDYYRQLSLLAELQKVDDEIYAVRQVMENAPKELSDLEDKFADIRKRRDNILDKLSHLEDQKKRLSFEIDDDSIRIKKSKNKLTQISNNREYQAMLREMDSMERINRNREEEKVALLEELQRQTENLDKINVDYEDIKGRYEEKQSSLDQTLQDCRADLEKLDRKRGEASKSLPVPIFMRYEFIRKRLEHPVIVPARDGVCSGCHIAMPPQTFIELQMGQQILNCPNCQRLIFWDQHYDGPTESRRGPRAETEPEDAEESTE
ncbi:MAG: hypothetical protein K2H64_04985 [Desulfovibrio sp.]|nr:hypothetical protein [Desulfovibrio sp.]